MDGDLDSISLSANCQRVKFATCGNATTLKLRCHFLEMTRNKEPEKAKFHGENLLYVKFGNKGWGGGGGGGGMGVNGYGQPIHPPFPGRTSPMIAVAQF